MPVWVARALNLLFWVGLIALLAGCGRVGADAEIKFCRSIIPALHLTGAPIEIIDAEAGAYSFGTLVKVVYRVAGETADTPDGTFEIRCGFAPTLSGAGQPELTHFATTEGAYGDVRLHLLKRFWIASGRLAIADPEPISGASRARRVPLGMAVMTQHLAGALPMIGIYALLATAYAVLYGLIGRINLAFGELTVLGGYGAYLGFSLVDRGGVVLAVVAAAAAGLYTAIAHGGAIGVVVLPRLVGRPGQHVLIATLGLAIAWSEAVRLLQGNGTRWMSPILTAPVAVVRSGDFVATASPMALLAAALACAACAGLLVVMRRSRFGRAWRATADDPLAAQMCGIDPKRILAASLVISGALAGLAGTLTTLMYGGVGHAGGLTVGLKALVAAVVGGIGSLSGAMIGALLLGIAEGAWSALFPIETRDIAIFILLAAWLVLRPQGIFGIVDKGEGWSRQPGRPM